MTDERARLVAGVPAGAAAALIPRLRVTCRGFDEGVEQRGEPSGPPEILRMPLHPEAEPRAGTLDRFDHAVLGRSRDDERCRDAADRLVMTAVHGTHAVAVQAERLPEARAAGDAHAVRRRVLR